MTITPVTPSAVDTKLPAKFQSSSKPSERAESAQFGKSPGHGTETIPGSASSMTLVVPTSSSGQDSASGSTDDYVPMETPTNEKGYMEMRRKPGEQKTSSVKIILHVTQLLKSVVEIQDS